MTSITATPTAHTATDTPATAWVRTVIKADAALCVISGVVLAGAAGPLADLAGLDTATPVVLPGLFLLLLGAGLAALARAGRRTLVALTPWSADGDFAWAAASLAVAVLTDLTGPGRALVAAQAVVVAVMGTLKLRAVRAAR